MDESSDIEKEKSHRKKVTNRAEIQQTTQEFFCEIVAFVILRKICDDKLINLKNFESEKTRLLYLSPNIHDKNCKVLQRTDLKLFGSPKQGRRRRLVTQIQ